MKVLVISRSPWKMNNSFGNSYSNFFSRMKDVEIANVYLADGLPDNNNNVVAYYKVSEKGMIKSFFSDGLIGEVVKPLQINQEDRKSDDENTKDYTKFMTFMKVNRWPLLYMLREFVWKFGKINIMGVYSFIEDFNPDVLFLPFYYALYVSRLALKVKEKFNIPIILEASSDIYTLKQVSFDPFFWVNRFMVRHMVRKVVNKSEMMYVISKKQQADYSKLLGIHCEVLYKYPDPTRKMYEYVRNDADPLYLFTGNLGAGRWKTLAKLGEIIEESGYGHLHIYSPTPLTTKMRHNMQFCTLHDAIPADKVKELQNRADILVHVESFDLKNRLDIRYAISTKIMDYISTCRCILAIGPKEVASIEFLQENQIAYIANNVSEIRHIVEHIRDDREYISIGAKKVSNYYSTRIESEQLQDELYSGIKKVISEYRTLS